MTKFLLILHLCTLVTNTCFESQISGYTFTSHYECARAGYKVSAATLDTLAKDEYYFGLDRINQEKIAIKFECKEMKTVVPLPKPKTNA